MGQTTNEYFREYYRANVTAKNKRQWKYYRSNPKRYLMNLAKKRAKKKGIPFTIMEEDFTLPHKCPVFGLYLEMHFGEGSDGYDNSYTLARLNNDLGYIPGNVVVISNKANRLKGDATIEELERLVSWLKTQDIKESLDG